MTDLERAISRRTRVPHRGRRIVVTLEPGDLLTLREERRRQTYTEPLAVVFDWFVKREAIRAIEARKAARKARRRA